MINLLFSGPSSACLELVNDKPYYAPASYTLRLNGEPKGEGSANVFSLFGLEPGKEYTLEVSFAADAPAETLVFTTASESCALNVKDFGAVGDGVADDSAAIQAAIHFLPEGGRLVFPAGSYLTAPLALKSHITLEFQEGAALLGHPDKARYPVIPGKLQDLVSGEELHFGAFEGNAMTMYQALITAEYAEDITVVGPGRVDGNAQNSDWWKTFREDPIARPRLFFFNRCRNVTVHGLHACNSASWQFHPYFSEDVSFYDVFISAPKDSPNTDAIDPESCDRVNIIGCRFSVGDDCIAVKSGKIELGRTFRRPADHHTVRNCLMDFGHGAVTLGSEIGAGVRNLSVSQCYFRGTDRGLRIKTRRGRGKDCVIDGVAFDNIVMDGVLTPVVINMWYNCCDPDRYSEYVWSRELLPVDERTPHLGSFTFRNLHCTGAQVAACYIDGLPEAPIDSVRFENVSVSFAEDAKPGVPAMENYAVERCRLGLYLDNVRNIEIDQVQLKGVDGEKLIASHYEHLHAENLCDLGVYEKIDEYVLRLIRESGPERTAWNIEKIRQGKPTDWNYIDGCMMTALEAMSEITGERCYSDFVDSFIDAFVAEDGSIRRYHMTKYNLDDINEGRALFPLYRRTGNEKFRRAAELLRHQLENQPRTFEGNFWHKAIYPHQVWLDGIYMAQPFYALFEKHFGSGDYADTVRQIENVRKRMYSEEKGLYFHGYDASRSIFWADKKTGCSQNFWLRSIGWFAVALADLLEILPAGEQHDSLEKIFTELMENLLRYMDEDTGMYWQVPDQPGREGNYLETSGSSMLAYAMLKGARLGVLDKKYAVQGQRTFNGIVDRYLSFRDGELNLGGICLVAGLGPADNRRRDGSYEYYISEPVVENDAKGVAPFLLCYTEVKRLLA